MAGGLRYYVCSTTQDDGGYGAKVLAERSRLRDVARGRNVPINSPQAPVQAAPKQVVASASTSASVDGGKRVHVTIDQPKKASPEEGGNDGAVVETETKHVASVDIGA